MAPLGFEPRTLTGYFSTFYSIVFYWFIHILIAGFVTLCYIGSMASHYVRKGSPFYWVKVRKPDGTWGGKSSGVKISTKGGLRKVRAMVADLSAKEQEEKDDGSGALFREWVDAWIDYQYENEKTAWRYRNAWTHLSEFLKMHNVIHPNEVTYQLCHAYMRWRTEKEKALEEGRRPCVWNTALTELRVLGAIEQEAVRRGYILANPCARLRLGRRNTKEKREITSDEIDLINKKIKKTHQWMQDTWLVGIKQGCRLSEVQVPMSDINEKGGVITFHVKGGKTHSAPLHADLLPLVRRARRDKRKLLVELPVNASRLLAQWFACHIAEGISFHCTRVTVVTRLARAGYSESQTMEYVGHCSDMVHSIYRKLRPADLKHLGDAL